MHRTAVRGGVNGRRALQDARHRRATDGEGTAADRSTLSVVVDTLWVWTVAVWVRLVGGAVWAVTGFYVGVLLDAAGAPVAEVARTAVAALPAGPAIGTTGAAALLAGVAFPVGTLWTLRWDDTPKTHRRRLIALVLLAVIPMVLSAVELATVDLANDFLSVTVTVPSGPVRAFYHVATTIAIAFGGALLWYRMKTGSGRSRRSTYY